MKPILILFIFIVLTTKSEAQISYSYDAAGNRIKRTTIVLQTKSDTINADDLKLTTVEENFGTGKITIYPNPVSSSLNISFSNTDNNKPVKAELYNLSGNLISTQNLSSTNAVIPMQQLAAGTYILIIKNNKQQNEFKILKQ